MEAFALIRPPLSSVGIGKVWKHTVSRRPHLRKATVEQNIR